MAKQLIIAGGEQFVLVPLSEYEQLAKAAKTLADSFERPALVPQLGGASPPIVDGESRLRAWRKHRGFTLEALGAAVGKTKGFLSEIETGQAYGKPALWIKLARTLNTDLEAILPDEEE